VDAGIVSRNSGAESNIEGGLALLARADADAFAQPLRSIVSA
jgi:hypothetical protein